MAAIEPRDSHEVLGLDPSATREQIQEAIVHERRVWTARTNHADVKKAREAEARIRDINESEKVLLNADRRRVFDNARRTDATPPTNSAEVSNELWVPQHRSGDRSAAHSDTIGSHWVVLGLDPSATRSDIEKAHRRERRQWQQRLDNLFDVERRRQAEDRVARLDLAARVLLGEDEKQAQKTSGEEKH